MADRANHMDELLIVLADMALKLVQPAGQVGIDHEDLPQPHERAHDFDVDLHGPFAVQDTGQHRHALLGESKGRVARIAMLLGTGHSS